MKFEDGYPRYSVRKYMNRWHVFWQSSSQLRPQPLPGGGFDTQLQAILWMNAQRLVRQKEWEDLLAKLKPEDRAQLEGEEREGDDKKGGK